MALTAQHRTVKLVHAADFHIGRPLPALLSSDKAEIRRKEIIQALASAVAFAREQGAHLFLISGDLFEHRYARFDAVGEVMELLRSIPDVRVFIAPGDQDPVTTNSFYATLDWPGNVTIFREPSLSRVVLEDIGVTVHGFGWTSFEESRELIKGYVCREGGAEGMHILMVHGELMKSPLVSSHLPMLAGDLAGTGASYVALGHVHQPGEMDLGGVKCVYPGSPEPLGLGESGEHGFYFVLLSGDGVLTTFVPVARRRMRRMQCDVSACDTLEKVRNLIRSVGTGVQRKRDFWEITLTGVIDPALDLDTDQLEASLSEEFFSLRLYSEVVPDYDVRSLVTLGDALFESSYCRVILERREQARSSGDFERDKLLERALYYGLDALRLKRVVHRGHGRLHT